MDLTVRLYNRNFSSMLVSPHVNMEVTSYSFSYRGGPDLCNITCWGPEPELWAMAENLRCPLEVLDIYGATIWWGYIHKVTVNTGAIAVGLSLESMNNRVCVTYSKPGADDRSETSWAYDYDSVVTYGTKEIMLSLGTGASAQADALRDLQLAERKYPTPVIEHQPGQNGQSATIECYGWYRTLDWKYFQNLAGAEIYDIEGLGTQYYGDSSSCMEVRQSFQIQDGVDPWPADHIELKMRKANNPTSAVWAEISTSAGVVLTSGSAAASDVGPNHGWISFALGTTVTINPGNLYWLRVHAASAADSSNYWVANVNEELSYTRGQFQTWSAASGWRSRNPDADMEFKVLGITDTGTQLVTAGSRAGQFFTNVNISAYSGVYASPYRDGTQLGQTVIEALLDSGTSNQRRIRAYVDQALTLTFLEEPGYTSPSLFMSTDGDLRDKLNNRVGYLCPVGDWCVLKDVFPKTFDDSYITSVGKFFIERVTYNVQSGMLRVEPRAGAEKFAVVKDG